MKNNINEFLVLFINKFCSPSVKRRSWNNRASRITEILNTISKKHFEGLIRFTPENVINSFYECGFTVMDNNNEEFDWEKFHKGSVFVTNNEFINIQSREIKDFALISRRKYPDNWKPETIKKMKKLNEDISQFWRTNKGLFFEN